MKIKTDLTLAAFVALSLLLLNGCGEKEADVPAPVPETAAPAPQVAQPVAPPTAAVAVAPDTRLVESQTALKAKNYDDAAASLVALQRTKLNAQQAAAAAAQMRQLQSSIAEAAAAGDPRAKAAADRLRQSAMAR